MSNAIVAIGAVIELSHRSTVEKGGRLIGCWWVWIDTIDSVTDWQGLVNIKCGGRLVLVLMGFTIKVTMVTMTWLASLCRDAVTLVPGSFSVLEGAEYLLVCRIMGFLWYFTLSVLCSVYKIPSTSPNPERNEVIVSLVTHPSSFHLT